MREQNYYYIACKCDNPNMDKGIKLNHIMPMSRDIYSQIPEEGWRVQW